MTALDEPAAPPAGAFACACGAILRPPCCGDPACRCAHEGELQCPDCERLTVARWGHDRATLPSEGMAWRG